MVRKPLALGHPLSPISRSENDYFMILFSFPACRGGRFGINRQVAAEAGPQQ